MLWSTLLFKGRGQNKEAYIRGFCAVIFIGGTGDWHVEDLVDLISELFSQR